MKIINKKCKFKEYLKIFDNEFDTNSRELSKDVPFLIALFQDFIQNIIQLTNTTKKVHADLVRTSDELRNTLEPYQIDLLEKMQDYDSEIQDDRERQAFVYGYVTAIHLKDESRKQYRRYRNSRKGVKYNGRKYNKKI